MDTDLSKIIAVCWPVLPSFLHRMLCFQISEVQVCILGSLRPDPQHAAAILSSSPAPGKAGSGCTGEPAHPPDLCVSFLVVPPLPAQASHSRLDNWIALSCPSCVCNILHNGILSHKRSCSKANNITTGKKKIQSFNGE